MIDNQALKIIRDMSRPLKALCDSHRASSEEDARAQCANLRVVIVPPACAQNVDVQATILTTVALAHRTFDGNVDVAKTSGLEARVPCGLSIGDMVRDQGGNIVDHPRGFAGQIAIGDAPLLCKDIPSVRTISTGWRGGIAPGHIFKTYPPGNILSGILSSGLAVTELFWRLHMGKTGACRRQFGFSLWDLSQGWTKHAYQNRDGFHSWKRNGDAWLLGLESDPLLKYMPCSAWFAGLGHLGQAYLWVMNSLVCFGQPQNGKAMCYLQDDGKVKKATHSTSVLTPNKEDIIGKSKARVCAREVERFGIHTNIIERKFDGKQPVFEGEPKLAFGGFDNLAARRTWNNEPQNGAFKRVIDVGLGANAQTFGVIKIYTFPDNQRVPPQIWPEMEDNNEEPDLSPEYLQHIQCGHVQAANQAVGIPSVGMVAAAFAISEALRILHDGKEYQAIKVDLMSPNSLSFHIREARLRENLGFMALRK